jgi:dihydroxy-acid dehydratase
LKKEGRTATEHCYAPGCDKNMPGALMAMGRSMPSFISVLWRFYSPSKWKGEDLNIVSAFGALGKIITLKILKV